MQCFGVFSAKTAMSAICWATHQWHAEHVQGFRSDISPPSPRLEVFVNHIYPPTLADSKGERARAERLWTQPSLASDEDEDEDEHEDSNSNNNNNNNK